MEDIDIWKLISETSILLSTSLSNFQTNLYKLRFTPPTSATPTPSSSSLCKKRFRSPYKKYRQDDRTWISRKERTSHEKEHSLFMYSRGSNVDRYTLASVPNTRRTL